MNPRSRPFILALLVTLGLLGGWRLQSLAREKKAFHKELWFRYLRGSLSDLLYGSSRLRPLLAKPRLSKAEAAELQDAVDHLRQSSEEAQETAVLAGKDPALQPLGAVVEQYRQIFGLFAHWKDLQGRPLAGQALDAEPDLLSQVWARADKVRQALLKEGTLSQDEVLEMNALLYSLKEGTEGKAGI